MPNIMLQAKELLKSLPKCSYCGTPPRVELKTGAAYHPYLVLISCPYCGKRVTANLANDAIKKWTTSGGMHV